MRRGRVRPKMIQGLYYCECGEVLLEGEDNYCPNCSRLILWKKVI
jgi:hypothetical protein